MRLPKLAIAATVAAGTAGAALLACGGVEARSLGSHPIRPPVPQQVQARSAPLKQARTALIPFETAPFPYEGTVAGTDKPFLNVEENGRLGHRTPFGRTYWQDETYSDA